MGQLLFAPWAWAYSTLVDKSSTSLSILVVVYERWVRSWSRS